MTLFEEKVNAYRENKRLMEELEAMNDAIKAEIIDMMQGVRRKQKGRRRLFIKTFRAFDLIPSYLKHCIPTSMQNAVKRPFTSVLACFERRMQNGSF